MSDIRFPFWQEVRKLLIDRQDGTYAERVEAYPPVKLMTDGDGDYARLRVDVGQTGFFAGRTFRTFQKLTIPSLTNRVIRIIVPVNVIIVDVSFSVEDSTCEITRRLGGTAEGPWTPIPVFRMNMMTTAPAVVNQVTLDYDGSHTGGTITDLIRITAANKTSAASSVVSERGIEPGTKYWVIDNVGNQTATVVFSAIWEERV